MIKAIVLDFDGLIFDTETPEYRAFQEIYKEYGLELGIDVWSQWVGTDISKFNPYDYLDESVGKPLNREEVRKLRRMKYEKLIAEERIRPGVEEYLKSAKDLGLVVGLASSAPRDWVMEHLTKLNLVHYFDCIRVREDAKKVKPDPDLYLQVINHFGIEPNEAIAFEDSPNGAKAAMNAKLYTVIVPNDLTKLLSFEDYSLRLNSLSEMELEQLIHTVIYNQD